MPEYQSQYAGVPRHELEARLALAMQAIERLELVERRNGDITQLTEQVTSLQERCSVLLNALRAARSSCECRCCGGTVTLAATCGTCHVSVSVRIPQPGDLVMPGWTCGCGTFNGQGRFQQDHCRNVHCGQPRP